MKPALAPIQLLWLTLNAQVSLLRVLWLPKHRSGGKLTAVRGPTRIILKMVHQITKLFLHLSLLEGTKMWVRFKGKFKMANMPWALDLGYYYEYGEGLVHSRAWGI